MSPLALTLVLSAACVHAAWNYLLKRSGGGTVFVWWFATASAAVYAPVALYLAWHSAGAITAYGYAFIAISGVLHTIYYMLLDRGYRTGDLSLVYPIARGSGPLMTVAVAILFLGEKPGPVAVTGALLIATGALLLTGDPRKLKQSGNLAAVGFALMTGCVIASYTVVDKMAVAAFMVPPLLQDWGTNLGRVALMTPLALKQRSEILPVWRQQRRRIIAIAILCPLSYILVLSAMVFTPVSYVAPAREISILIAAVLGTQLLSEGRGAQRLFAAAAMVVGVMCVAYG